MIDGKKRSPVPSEEGYLGDLVAWTFGDAAEGKEFAVKRERVRQIFLDHGFDPDEVLMGGEAGRMLAWAPRSGGIKLGKGQFVKELARPNKDTPLALGVYERTAIKGEAGDDWQPGARVRIVNDIAVAMSPEGEPAIAGCLKKAEEIAARANFLVENVCNQELSAALVRAGQDCRWAQFRRGTGGAYWVPPYTAERYRGLLDALEKERGGFWPIVQPLFGDSEGRTGANVNAAAVAAIVAELAEVSADLERCDELKQKTLEARVDRCRQIVLRANLYAVALKGDLAKIVGQVEAVSSKYAALIDYASEANAFDAALEHAVGQ